MSNVLPFRKPIPKKHLVVVKKSWHPSGGLLRGLIKFVWVISVIIWPVVKWFIVLDLLFAFLKMVFNTEPASTWYFMAHALVAISIYWFVRLYNPPTSCN